MMNTTKSKNEQADQFMYDSLNSVFFMQASTDAVDTDFTAKLFNVLPDDTAYNLTDGIIRANYRHRFTLKSELNREIVQDKISLS